MRRNLGRHAFMQCGMDGIGRGGHPSGKSRARGTRPGMVGRKVEGRRSKVMILHNDRALIIRRWWRIGLATAIWVDLLPSFQFVEVCSRRCMRLVMEDMTANGHKWQALDRL
jgi:hypothetical protein